MDYVVRSTCHLLCEDKNKKLPKSCNEESQGLWKEIWRVSSYEDLESQNQHDFNKAHLNPIEIDVSA